MAASRAASRTRSVVSTSNRVTRESAAATLRDANALLARLAACDRVETLLLGLREELELGLAKLTRADAATDHVAWYRNAFSRRAQQLRDAVFCPTPDLVDIIELTHQLTWLAHIWPVLNSARLQRRGPANFKQTNTDRQAARARAQARCLDLARRLRRPTAAQISARYRNIYSEKPPALRTIRPYLETLHK